MKMKQKKLIGSGLVFGASIGIIIGPLFSLDIGLTMAICSAVGIIVGSAFANKK